MSKTYVDNMFSSFIHSMYEKKSSSSVKKQSKKIVLHLTKQPNVATVFVDVYYIYKHFKALMDGTDACLIETKLLKEWEIHLEMDDQKQEELETFISTHLTKTTGIDSLPGLNINIDIVTKENVQV